MTIRKSTLFFMIALMALTSGCQTILAEPTATPTLPPTSTQTPVPPTLTSTPVPPTPTLTHTPTTTATETPVPNTPTETEIPEAVIRENQMKELVQSLFDEGIIHTTEGKYDSIEDFSASWAQLYWYQWYHTGFTPESFILRVDASWESASRTANWADSGCGFVFSEKDVDNHHAVFLNLDGYVRTLKFMNGYWYDQQAGYYGMFDIPSDSAEIILIVEDQMLTVIVNGKQVIHYKDIYIQRGNLGLSLASGTNTDFGTKCDMVNIDYWLIN